MNTEKQIHEGARFEKQSVRLDAAIYRHCSFIECDLYYGGKALPTLEFNTFERCSWIFDGEAGNTLLFLQALYKGGGEEFVRNLCDTIMGKSAR